MKSINNNYTGLGLTASLVFFVGVNLYQLIKYINLPYYSGDTYSYGFPFAVYEYLVTLSRGRIIWSGVLGNIFITILAGYTIGFFFKRLSYNRLSIL
jgi:hypothetical protein